MPLFKKIQISQQDHIFFVDYQQIIFLKSDNCYTNFIIKGGKSILVSKSLARLQKELEPETFIRVNQSYLVNKHCIECVNKKKKLLDMYDNHTVHFTISLKELMLLMNGTTSI